MCYTVAKDGAPDEETKSDRYMHMHTCAYMHMHTCIACMGAHA